MQVEGINCLEAWKCGVAEILEREQYHLVTKIDNPTYIDEDWFTTYSPRSVGVKQTALTDVVNTIFPRKLAERFNDRGDFYNRYLKIHRRRVRLGAKKKSAWGTYFQRLIAFGPSNHNQLDDLIELLIEEDKHYKVTNPLHISSVTMDSIKRRYGGPCLQYIQIIQPQFKVLDMFVVYRNHDFLDKALGNFVGLGQLLKFIARETNMEPGKLICHSAHAYTPLKGALRELSNI